MVDVGNHSKLKSLFLFVFLVFGLFLIIPDASGISFDFIESNKSNLSQFLSVIAIIVAIYFRKNQNFLSFSFLFFSVLWVFHFSALLITNIDLVYFKELNTWMANKFWYISARYSFLCYVICLCGNYLSDYYDFPLICENYQVKDTYVSLISFVGALILAVFLYNIVQGLSYLELLDLGAKLMSTISYISLFLGAMFIYGSGTHMLLSFLFQCVISGFLVALGARGVGLYGFVCLAVLVGFRFPNLKWFLFLLMLIVILVVIPSVGFARRGVEVNVSMINLYGVLEMGGSLHTVSRTMQKLEKDELQFQYGKTYLLPLERYFLSIFGIKEIETIDLQKKDLSKEPRYYGYALDEYLGGSIIGESYYNFGYFGSIFFLPIGFIIGLLDNLSKRSDRQLLCLGIYYPLLFCCRDHFLPVLSSIFSRLILILILLFMANQLRQIFKFRTQAVSEI